MDIRLKQLHMENFKCHKALTLDFGGENSSIYGDNATGKTSVYDAFVWLLFGKDSAGNGEKNIEIKPLAPDGSVKDHQAITEVEAVLLADGEEISLKRTYQEVWSTKRGSSEATYDGNTSEYFVDGVPCKANAYKSRVAELVDEEQFRLLTTVSYFPDKMPWQKRRETLFDLFGVLDDKQIMETDSRFAPLMEAMGDKRLEDLKKILTVQRKGLMVDRNEIPARISECEKTIEDLSGLDFDSAEAQIDILNARRDSLNTELLAIQQNTAVQSKELELREARMALTELERENRLFHAKQMKDIPSTEPLTAEKHRTESYLLSARRRLETFTADRDRSERLIEDTRAKWKAKNAETYTGSDICPTCGQKLPESSISNAFSRFEEQKKYELSSLVRYSQREKEAIARFNHEISAAQSDIAGLEQKIQELDKQIADTREMASNMGIRDMEHYQERREAAVAKVKALEEELDSLKANADGAASGIRMRLNEVKSELDKCSAILGKKSALEYARNRIDQLRQDAKNASEKLSELDRIFFLMEDFSRYKAGYIEDGINDKFRLARFRLFREQANGGVEERCDVTYDGVPYIGLNNGMKINVGIDIINTLSRAYGVTVPLFVDNAESVTKLEKCGFQVVRLVVSENDKELRVTNG